MGHEELTDLIREQAALYALGLLDSGSERLFEEHLQSGCAVCAAEVRAATQTAALLPFSLPQHDPPPRLRKKLLAQIEPPSGPQIWKQWRPDLLGGIHVVRGQAEDWQNVAEGITAKQLYADPERDTVTMLIRMEPGSAYPAHRHGGPEQCFVIEGDVEVGDLVLHAGDYQCAAGESVHQITTTKNGCTLLIVSSLRDELL